MRAALIALNARTIRAPGSSSADASPAPFSRAHVAMSPSREVIGLHVSITTLPASRLPRSLPTSGSARYGTEMSSTSPKAAASRGVPARALGPRLAASFLSASRSRDENMTSWPAFTQTAPSAPPTRPDPTVPIFSSSAAARAANGTPPSARAAVAVPARTRNPRRSCVMANAPFRMLRCRLGRGATRLPCRPLALRAAQPQCERHPYDCQRDREARQRGQPHAQPAQESFGLRADDVAAPVYERVDERLRLVPVGAGGDGEQRLARGPHDAALNGAERRL